MSESVGLSEAKKTLLDKCVRGDASTAGMIQQQTQSIGQQEGEIREIVDREATQRAAVSAQTSSRDHDVSTSPPSAADLKATRKSLIRRVLNRILHLLCRFAPGTTTLRPFLHRLRGVRIGKNVEIGEDVYLENEYPECVEIQDGAMVGLRTIIVAHTQGVGRVVIGKDAFVGAGSVIVTSGSRTLVIGEGSVIMASSLVTSSVAPYTLYGSDSAKPLARITKPLTKTSYEEFIAALRPLPR